MNSSTDATLLLDVSDSTTAWLVTANGVELCFLGCSLLVCFFILHVITGSRPLIIHDNLSKLVRCMGCAWIVSRLARVFTCSVLHFHPDLLVTTPAMVYYTHPPAVYYAEWVRVCMGATALSTLAMIVVERVVATVRLKRYETQQNNKLVATAVIMCLTIAAFITAFTFNKTNSNLGLSSILSLAGSIFTIVFFCTFERLNRRRHRNAMRNNARKLSMADTVFTQKPSMQYTLSERFQLTENIRIFGALKRICIAVSLFNAVNMSVVAADLLLVTNPTDHLITRSLFNLMVTFGSMVVMLTAVTSTPLWKRVAKARLRQLLRLLLCGSCKETEKNCSATTRLHAHRLSSCPTLDGHERDNRVTPLDAPVGAWSPSAPSTIPFGLMDTDGKPLHFQTEAANEIYFKQLNAMWR